MCLCETGGADSVTTDVCVCVSRVVLTSLQLVCVCLCEADGADSVTADVCVYVRQVVLTSSQLMCVSVLDRWC